MFMCNQRAKGGKEMPNKPKEIIKVSDIQVCIWENMALVDGKHKALPNITFQRIYSKNGKLKSTYSFRVKDLPNLAQAIEQASKYFM